jgi:hypothetical protein
VVSGAGETATEVGKAMAREPSRVVMFASLDAIGSDCLGDAENGLRTKPNRLTVG